MICKYTEMVVFTDGHFSVKEKRVCVKPAEYNGLKVIKCYWADRLDSCFYILKYCLNSGAQEVSRYQIELHKQEKFEQFLDIESVFVSLETIK